MRLFAIGDLHMSGGDDKPMDVFGPQWDRHFFHIRENWIRQVGEDDIVMQEVALIIQAYNLTTCAEAWVNTHHTLLTKGTCHQQLLQVADKDADGFLVGFLT